MALLSLVCLWAQRGDDKRRVYMAVGLASLYWLTQAGSLLFPGTALFDPELMLPEQLTVDVVMLTLLSVALFYERARLRHSDA